MTVTVDDGVVITGTIAIEIIEREKERVHGAQDRDRLGQRQTIDMELYGANVIAVYAIVIGGQLRLRGSEQASEQKDWKEPQAQGMLIWILMM